MTVAVAERTRASMPVGCRRVGGRRTLVARSPRQVGVLRRRARIVEPASALPDAKLLRQAAETAKSAVESAAALVPESVPRPAAKALVTGLFGLFAVVLLKSVLSTALTAVLLGGLGWFALNLSSSSSALSSERDDDETLRVGGPADSLGDDDDPLEEARRIMSKYKD